MSKRRHVLRASAPALCIGLLLSAMATPIPRDDTQLIVQAEAMREMGACRWREQIAKLHQMEALGHGQFSYQMQIWCTHDFEG